MITRVNFHRFKQFADQSFDLHSGISLLAGGNNAGKSTILHGLAIWEFCRTAIEMERGASAFVAGYRGQGLGLGDDEFSPINVPSLKHLWTNLKTQKDAEPERKQLYIAFKSEIPELVILSLRDRDDEPSETVGADLVDPTAVADASFHPRRWRRRYIESYLVWPPAIAAAAGLEEEAVRQALTDSHGIAVGANFTDANPPQALLDVRAKRIFKEHNAPPVVGQFAVTALEVARQLPPEAIADDIKTFLADITTLA